MSLLFFGGWGGGGGGVGGGVSSEINRPSLNRNPQEQDTARDYNSHACHLNTYESKWRASVKGERQDG